MQTVARDRCGPWRDAGSAQCDGLALWRLNRDMTAAGAGAINQHRHAAGRWRKR